MKFLSFLLAFLFLISVQSSAYAVNELSSLAESNNTFAFNMLRELNSDKNIVFSPFSIYTALSIASLGAGGITREEFDKVLNNNLSLEQFHQSYKDIIDSASIGSNKFNIANAIWLDSGFQPEEDFLNSATNLFDSHIENLDFQQNPKDSSDTINSWIEQNTNGLIKNLLSPGSINSNTRMILTNAIYFKGNWEKAFNPKEDSDLNFYVTSDKPVKTTFMQQDGVFFYYENQSKKLLQLDYKGNSLSLVIILPEKNIDNFIKNLSDEEFRSLLRSTKPEMLDIKIPKFKFIFTSDLTKQLTDLGIKSAFTTNADFSGIAKSEDLYISDVVHQAYIDVNEAGTEAAATTSIGFVTTAYNPIPVKNFIADRPFIFAIMDNKTKTILFLGKILNPQ
ncbi:serpin B [Thermodesulfobium acidiphilum]|uniref:Serpin B n=1 Tax=Thermodesulfobium acidiphilum TaxID=1794699 RepID=A0A2R4W0Z7_THEAF|nr:serpin family protein [Thermodesulfobium acidiphilum]AWB10481.1 serpin B [Thermodesulfobium acidiphilum]